MAPLVLRDRTWEGDEEVVPPKECFWTRDPDLPRNTILLLTIVLCLFGRRPPPLRLLLECNLPFDLDLVVCGVDIPTARARSCDNWLI